jgi:hypothetical protein
MQVLVVAAAALAQAPASEAAPVLVLPAGTEIELMVVREVDSDRSQPGDPVKLRVNRPVTVGDTVVIPVGAEAQGEVTATRKSGGMLRRGNIAVDITSLSVGGREVPLSTMLEQRGRGGSDDVLKVAMAPMWILFARGNGAKLKAGELISAQVDGSICFAADGNGYAPVPCAEGAAPAEAAADAG